ncbi:hypothetical protein GCM10009753_54070 [Streptantibioticus ferralitis]
MTGLPGPLDGGIARGARSSNPPCERTPERGQTAWAVRDRDQWCCSARREGGYRVPEVNEDKRMRGRLWPGLLLLQSISLASSRPGRIAPNGLGKERTNPKTAGSPQLVRALALHGVSRPEREATWGHPLTRGDLS